MSNDIIATINCIKALGKNVYIENDSITIEESHKDIGCW